ncbi:Uncharacterised protein [Enterobacter cloacae]|nr:Uncharacterised protein [Enterobacter cloacae]
MLNPCGRNLRRNYREARACPGERLHIFRIKHGGRLHFIACGDQRQLLDLPDINAEIADGHAFCQFTGIKGVQGNLPPDRARRGFGREEDPLVTFTHVAAGAAQVIEADRTAQGTGERRCLYGQPAAVELHFRATLSPEHAVWREQLAVLRLDMQFDIKRVRTRTNGDHFPHLKLTVKHDGACLDIRQRFSA